MPDTFDELTGTARLHEDQQAANKRADGTDKPAAMLSELASPAAGEESVRTPALIRSVAKELTRYGLIEAARKPNLYRVLVTHQKSVAAILEPLDLGLASDTEAKDPEDWSHPLVRRQRLTLEQSLLVAMLRQRFVVHEQEAGVGADDARVAVDELIPEFQLYLGDPGSGSVERAWARIRTR